MKDISIGKYYHGDSIIHQLDPRTKMLSFLCLLISIFIAEKPLILILISFLIIVAFLLSRIKLCLMIRYIKPILWLLLPILLLHIFFTNSGSESILSLSNIKATRVGLYKGILACCHFLLIAIYSALLVITTMPIQLAEGISYFLRPLKRLKIPVEQIPIMIMLTLKFIPNLFAEGEKLISSQKIRGSQFESKNPIKKIQLASILIIPLLRNCFRMADELAISIESRCYHNGIRTNLYELRFTKADYIVISVSIIIDALAIIFTISS